MSDDLAGQPNTDILIASVTVFDDDIDALQAIMAEWTADSSYAERVERLTSTGPGPYLNGLPDVPGVPVTVLNDQVPDVLSGNRGRDWFFADFGLDGDFFDDDEVNALKDETVAGIVLNVD